MPISSKSVLTALSAVALTITAVDTASAQQQTNGTNNGGASASGTGANANASPADALLNNLITQALMPSTYISPINLSPLPDQGCQNADDCMGKIQANTHWLYATTYNTFLAADKLLKAWTTRDDSAPTTTMQANFTELGNMLNELSQAQLASQGKFNTDLFNKQDESGNSIILTVNEGNPVPATQVTPQNSSLIPYGNDLAFSSVLGQPYFEGDKDPRKAQDNAKNPDIAYNYIKNISGVNLLHVIPSANWKGTRKARSKYQQYFNLVMSAESFNAYALSQLYTHGKKLNDLQTKLIQQASDPGTWFAEVASENIGFVLRQLLMYQSQTFVLQARMIDLQRQAVTAQAITNALLIANNQMNESLMLTKAQGAPLSEDS